MKKILGFTIIYLFLFAAPLSSSDLGNNMPMQNAEKPEAEIVQLDTGLTDKLSSISSGVVQALNNILK